MPALCGQLQSREQIRESCGGCHGSPREDRRHVREVSVDDRAITDGRLRIHSRNVRTETQKFLKRFPASRLGRRAASRRRGNWTSTTPL